MKQLYILFIALILLISACKKTELPVLEEACIEQTADPMMAAYDTNQVHYINYSGKHCGFMPLNSKSYWVYEDSLFDSEGNFNLVQIDTLRYSKTLQSPDNLIWWETKKDIGLPRKLYASDDAIYGLQKGTFIMDSFYSKREFYVADSVNFLSGFNDIIAFGKIVRRTEPVETPAGIFYNYILFEKYSPGYRRDKVYFVPGLGVIQYTSEFYKAPGPPSKMKLFIKSSLVSYYAGK